jgi:hypothetical protein
MMPIDGMFKIAALPLNSGFSSSAQEPIGRLIRSGLQVAGRHDLLEREELGVDQVEAVGRGDGALGHVVGGDGHVLDLDAGVGLELLGDGLVLVHRGAQVAQHDFFLRMHEGRDARGQDAGGALQQGAALDAGGGVDGFGHGRVSVEKS